MNCRLIINSEQCTSEAWQSCSNCKRDICLGHLQFHDILNGGGAMLPSCLECDLASIKSNEARNRRQRENGLQETAYIPLSIEPA